MNNAIHLNLLRDEERVSSSRVRLHVMAPVFAAVMVAGVALWWAWLWTQTLMAQSQTRAADEAISQLQAAFKRATEATGREQELKQLLAQVEIYRHGAARYGVFLRKLAEQIPATIQLTQLELVEPPPQVIGAPAQRGKKAPPSFGPNSPEESVRLRLSGRTLDAASLDKLLGVLRAPAFREMIETATVPKGAFRQEQDARGGSGQEFFRFDVECTLKRRVFE